MLRYVIGRLLLIPLILLGIATIAFGLSNLPKGDPVLAIVGERQMNDPEIVEVARKRWGLDRPLHERYVTYLANLARGDFGTSFRTRRPVAQDLMERLPATLELVLAAMVIGTAAGVGFGVVAARFRQRLPDHAARLFALLGSSVPVFWSGLMLLFLFWIVLGWLPGPGRLAPRSDAPELVTGFFTVDSVLSGDWPKLGESLMHLILPACVLGWAVAGVISRLVRASMLDVLGQDFVLAARAKGASNLRVLLNHALRNSLIPILTIIGFSFAYLITGAVLTESVFSWPGIGSYTVQAARALDYPAIIGVTVVGGTAFLLTNLLTDIAYVLVDPRVRLK